MNEALWRRIDAALDARVDPFDDPDLAAALAREPEAELATRRLMGRLALLGDLPMVGPRHARARRVAAVAAALVLLFFGVATFDWHRTQPSIEGASRLDPIDTVSLVFEHTSPPPARGARVVLEPRFVMEWTLEGVTQ